MNQQPKFRRPLNPAQLLALQYLFKFRYVTAPLLALAIGRKSRRTLQQTLQALEEQDFVGKKYEARYRLAGKQAIYYLRPKAIRELHKRYGYNEQVLHVMLRNRSRSEDFMEHNLLVMKAYISLQRQYPKTFNIFTKWELGGFDYFIKPAPDLYLVRINKEADVTNEYLLDLYEYKPAFVIRNRIDAYLKHSDYGDWQHTNGSGYPVALICCPSPRIENNVLAYAEKKIEQSGIEMSLLTSTIKALLEDVTDIWCGPQNPEELVSLNS